MNRLTAACVFAAALAAVPAQADLYHASSSWDAHADFAVSWSFSDSVALLAWEDIGGTTRYQSGFFGATNKFIASEHGSIYEGLSGTNYRIQRGFDAIDNPTEIIPITQGSWVTDPRYSGVLSPGDLRIFTTPYDVDVDPLSLYTGEFEIGMEALSFGYGIPKVMGQEEGPIGTLRADRWFWEEPHDDYYLKSIFWPDGFPHYDPLGGRLKPGSSGGPVFVFNSLTDQYEVTAINSAFDDADAYFTRTFALDLTEPVTFDFYHTNVPEPGTLLLMLAGASCGPCWARRLVR